MQQDLPALILAFSLDQVLVLLSFGGKLASLDVHVDMGKAISLPC